MSRNIILEKVSKNSLWFLFVLGLFFYSQRIEAQESCGDVAIKTYPKDSPCSDNGQIRIVVTGTDIDNGNYFGLEFRAYLTGTPPPTVWTVGDGTNEYTFRGLPAGTYTVDVRGKCKGNANKYVEQLQVKKDILIKQEPWTAIFARIEASRKVLVHTNDGAVKFSMVSGGAAPYTVVIEDAPAGYTGPREKKFPTLKDINDYEWGGLWPGNYRFVLKSGDYCQSQAAANITMESFNTVPRLMADYIYPGQAMMASNDRKTDAKYNRSIVINRKYYLSGDPFYYYSINSSKYFEYNYYYKGEGQAHLQQEWKDVPDGNYGKLHLENMKYTQDEIVKDAANKKPVIVFRLKQCPDSVFKDDSEQRLYRPSLGRIKTYTNNPCSKLIIYPDGDTYPEEKVLCWPVVITLEKYDEATKEYNIIHTHSDSMHYRSYVYDFKDTLTTPGIYRYKYKSACGTEYTTSSQELLFYSPVTYYSASFFQRGCDKENLIPYLSVPDINSLVSVKLIKVQKSVAGGAYVDLDGTEVGYRPPNFPEWKKTDMPQDSINGNYSYRYINLWAKSKGWTALTGISLEHSDTIKQLREYVDYRVVFEATDTCGFTRQITTYSNYPNYSNDFYETAEEPVFSLKGNCDNEAELTIPNLNKLYKKHNRRRAPSISNPSFTGSARVIDGPEGGYNKSYTSTDSPTMPMKLTKPGTYTVKVDWYTPDFSLVPTCYERIYKIVVEVRDILFGLDKGASAAFRCVGSKKGDEGYISIKVVNGSGGPYVYELFQVQGSDTIKLSQKETTGAGVFENWGNSAIASDDYMVRVTDKGCRVERSFYEFIQVVDISKQPIAWADSYNVCTGSNLGLHALALGVEDQEYIWRFSGDPNWQFRGKDPVLPNARESQSGYYTVEVDVPFCRGVFTDTVYVSVNDRTLYWNPAAADGNWYNRQNWLFADGTVSNSFPSACTSVHIPGNADHYPNLSGSSSPAGGFGDAVCDTIYFHYGSQMANTTALKYSHAKVQYNFGYYGTSTPSDNSQPTLNAESKYPNIGSRALPVMSRSKWYMLSAPLKKMVAADFSLAGYPNSFQRLYNTHNPNTQEAAEGVYTKAFEKQDLDLKAYGSALSVAVWPYNRNMPGASDQKYLESMKGIIELPYVLNADMKKVRPLHRYNGLDSISSINYYSFETLQPIVKSIGKIRRGYNAYRFVYENDLNVADKQIEGNQNISVYKMPLYRPLHGNKIMIGNPLMSHIDFDKLYNQNKSIIKNYYQITNASTGDTITYTVGGASSTAPRQIAPLQGFIVERLNPSAANEQLTFYLEGYKSVETFGPSDTPLPKPRSLKLNDDKGWVLILATALDSVSFKPYTETQRLLFGACDEPDVRKYIATGNLGQRAEIFIVGDDGKWYKDLNDTPQDKSKRYQIGIVSQNKKDINLKFSPGGDIIRKVEFVDKYLGKSMDVTNGGDYKFKHRTHLFSGIEGADLGRFELVVTYK